MVASTQYKLSAADLETVLALVRFGTLADAGERLVEIHGQHEHQALLDRTQQLAMLDGFAAHPERLAEVAQSAQRWSAASARTRGGVPAFAARSRSCIRASHG